MLLYAIYQNAYLTFRQTKNDFFRGLSLGYLAGFFAMLAHGIGANTFIIVRIMEPFWFLTAMIIMIPAIETGQTTIAAEDNKIINRPSAIKHHSG